MDKKRIEQIKREKLVSIDNVIFEPMPRDKYIYEYTNDEFEKEIQKEMNWLGISVLSLIVLVLFIFSFSLLAVANLVIADKNIDDFKSSSFLSRDE